MPDPFATSATDGPLSQMSAVWITRCTSTPSFFSSLICLVASSNAIEITPMSTVGSTMPPSITTNTKYSAATQPRPFGSSHARAAVYIGISP